MNSNQTYNFDEIFVQDGWNLSAFPHEFYESGKKHMLFMSPYEFEIRSAWNPALVNLAQFSKYVLENNIKVDLIFGGNDIFFCLKHILLPAGSNFHLWPMYWAMKSLMDCDWFLNSNNLSITDINLHPNQPYVFLNANVRWHRLLTMDQLYKRNILNESLVSWQNRGPTCEQIISQNKATKISWTPKTIIQDNGMQDPLMQGYSWYNPPKMFHDAFVALVGETTTRTTFFTEKIWIPIMFKKPFLVISNNGYYKSLKRFGFELYDEIFDYSFDDEPNELTRVKLVVDNVERIMNADYNKLMKSIEPKIIKNYKLLLSNGVNLENIPNIILQWFNYLENSQKELTSYENGWLKRYQDIKNATYLKKFI